MLRSVPYFGTGLYIGGTVVLAFLQFETFRMALLAGASSATIASLVGLIITPWMTSKAARMNAGAVFITLLFWSWIWGIWGLLLGTPIIMVVKTLCDHIEELNSIGELLGE